MTDAEIAIIGKLAATLRAHGVSKFSDVPGGAVSLEFHSTAPDVPAAKDAKGLDVEMCKCGHPVHAHVAGLCVVGGCEPGKCAGGEE